MNNNFFLEIQKIYFQKQNKANKAQIHPIRYCFNQCCGSVYYLYGSGSSTLTIYGSGSGSRRVNNIRIRLDLDPDPDPTADFYKT